MTKFNVTSYTKIIFLIKEVYMWYILSVWQIFRSTPQYCLKVVLGDGDGYKEQIIVIR